MQASHFLLSIFLAVYSAELLLKMGLEGMNRKFILANQDHIPREFRQWMDPSKMRRMTRYALARSRLVMCREVTVEVALLGILFLGVLTGLEALLERWPISQWLAGILFFLIPGFVLYVIQLPFSYRNTFVLEEAYGFNRSTPRLWLTDQVKAGVLSALIFCAILIPVFWIMKWSPDLWWLWGFLFVSTVQCLLVGLYPVCIAPLFNTFQSIRDEELAEKIRLLMERNGIRVKRVLQMDAGMRSGHTNAYFTGIGRTKQIVLFDTLLESHPHDEILAILAHELGHYKEKHVVKQLFFFSAVLFSGFWATHQLLGWDVLYQAFGFSTNKPYIGLFLLSVLWQKTGFFLKPLPMALSRHFERRADRFAALSMGTAAPMMASFKRLAEDNLANLNPHPIYVLFHYSHPPLAERVRILQRLAVRMGWNGPETGHILETGAI